MTKRLLAIAVAMVMVVGLIELATPGGAGAVPVSKNLSGTCSYADKDTSDLLTPLVGPALSVGFRVDADIPKTLNPGQSGVPISFTWTVNLDPSLTGKAGAAGVKEVTVRNAKLDTAVAGPTSTTAVLGRPGDSVVSLAGGGSSISQGPFTGTLDNVGQAGVITYKTGDVSFTISVSLAGERNLNLNCSAPGLIASTPIKVPGSPDIVQPIELQAGAGASVAVDVLGQYVTPGKTPLVPSSLKVIDGPGSIQNGQVVVNAGGAPSANSVTFEVCGVPVKVADFVSGKSETQHLVLERSPDLLKKSLGFTLKFDGQETRPIWTATPNVLGTGLFGNGPLAYGLPTTKVANWQNQAGNYAVWTDPSSPSPAVIQAALEQLPNIGAGNVKVTQTKAGEYDLTFQGALADKDVPSVSLGDYYSNLPQESLDDILKAAGALSAGSSGPTTTTTIPAGLSANDYIVQLILQGNTDEAGRVLSGQILGGIDVSATLGAISALFPAKPNLTTPTETQGVDPIPEQFQDLCSQGSVTVTVAAPPVPPAAVLPSFSFSAAPAAKAPAAKSRCSVKTKKVRVRIKGTKKYRTVTKKVRVCTKVKAKKKSTKSTKYKKSSKKSSSKKKATVRRSSSRRR